MGKPYRGVKPVFSIGDEEEYDTGVVVHYLCRLSSGTRSDYKDHAGTNRVTSFKKDTKRLCRGDWRVYGFSIEFGFKHRTICLLNIQAEMLTK